MLKAKSIQQKSYSKLYSKLNREGVAVKSTPSRSIHILAVVNLLRIGYPVLPLFATSIWLVLCLGE